MLISKYIEDKKRNSSMYYVLNNNHSTPVYSVEVKVADILTLCEIEIYGDCKPHTFGLDCIQNCSSNCRNSECHTANGYCFSCNNGYTGTDCSTRCRNKTYGESCLHSCSTNCTEQLCNPESGKCYGCPLGKKGEFCNQECQSGTYGDNCSKQCSENCTNRACDSVSGNCKSCPAGKKGDYCQFKCQSGTYGDNCSKQCSENCTNRACDSVSGNCKSCPAGKKGDYCQFKCQSGTYGDNCSKQCSENCKNRACDSVSGNCKSCPAGKKGDYCQFKCQSGTYGDNCSKQCSENCTNRACDSVSGNCKSCPAGKKGDYCQFKCQSGTYGDNCSKQCSENCTNRACDSVSGNCKSCPAGKKGDYCQFKCQSGTYGDNCSKQCSENCTNRICDSASGRCKSCPAGKKGDYCQLSCELYTFGLKCNGRCSSQCKGWKCDPENGNCLSCYDGYKGSNCSTPCDEYHFGERCLNQCSSNCMDSKCNRTNGNCFRCYNGFQGPTCLQPCYQHRYGQGCIEHCGLLCFNQLCNHVTGDCNSCVAGRAGAKCTEDCPVYTYGLNCTNKCSDNCAVDGRCDPANGTCLHGCVAGYHGEKCSQTCDNGKYGENCLNNCSFMCVVNATDEVCNKVNGTCLIGCRKPFSIADDVCSLFWGELTQSENSTHQTMFISLSVLVVAVAAVLVIIFIVTRRKRNIKTDNETDVKLETLENVTAKNLTEEYNQEEKSIGTSPSTFKSKTLIEGDSKVIALGTLFDFIKTHQSDFFVEEFQNIPSAKNVNMAVGLSDENKNKNRYKNICAYDHSRVHLEINTLKNEGDYINASYIEGYNNKDKFIASQGPNNVMLNDFVRMLWEQNVEVVVMLTNLIEEGKVKCERYWPEKESTMFGDIKVELASTQVFADYTIRKLELKKKRQPVHTLTHFHFTSWPDQGVPSNPWGLVDFEQRVALESTSRPVVVHCSAGVGRTGTFIALRNVIKEAEDTGKINFFNTVAKLRQDRVLMIQTAGQYEFLHRAAQVALCCRDTTITLQDIPARLQLLQQKTISGQTNLEKEFTSVSAICSDLENKYKETNTEQEDTVYQNNMPEPNRDKNRVVGIIPKKEYRVFLSCESPSMDDYINAVFVPSFTKRESHILTQLPMPTTVINFWKMVVQYKVSLIVAFQSDTNKNDETIGQYLPANVTVQLVCGPYTIHTGQVHTGNVWEELEVSIKPTSKTQGTVVHKLTHMNIFAPHLNARDLLTLTAHARSKYSCSQDKVLFMCRDGAGLCGLACVLGQLLDRADHDQRVCVPLVVGSLKCVRPEIIPSVTDAHNAPNAHYNMSS
ncbi:uncharacterized protein LOC131951611 [Physella acuta]|uniref:uncharacterized protein LOC131951611 n=1 Tax=Physella acuta TaxID=109671 RepID=UPI0027DB9EAE|nr:uncharacterized protein LOC131951611 [Physella acuta]